MGHDADTEPDTPDPEPDTPDTEPDTPDTTVIVLLAAGAGSRFHGPDHKLTATIDGRSVADRAVASAVAADVGPVVVVTGSIDLPIAAAGPVEVVRNQEWASGQSSSLAVGIRRADQLGAAAVIVGLADQPFIDPRAWRLLAAATSPIAVATYDGARRNPVRLHRSIWPLLPTSGDEGARSLIRLRADLVQEVPCPGSPADIDTLEDLRTWQSKSSTSSP
ncbi:MAG TPA: nucleotidyltransferase family protein [Ilumatobacter sp.]|nr:nucleotidyltransferase family protein [Ilumatobacter sp.]